VINFFNRFNRANNFLIAR